MKPAACVASIATKSGWGETIAHAISQRRNQNFQIKRPVADVPSFYKSGSGSTQKRVENKHSDLLTKESQQTNLVFLSPLMLVVGPIDREVFAALAYAMNRTQTFIVAFLFISRLRPASRFLSEIPNLPQVLLGAQNQDRQLWLIYWGATLEHQSCGTVRGGARYRVGIVYG